MRISRRAAGWLLVIYGLLGFVLVVTGALVGLDAADRFERLATDANEAITSLLLNYVAGLVLTWLVFEPWKDPASLGQAYSEELDARSRLPIMWGERVHAGILLAVVALSYRQVCRAFPNGGGA